MNLYEYVTNNPTNYTDLWGLWTNGGMMQEFGQKYGAEGQLLLAFLDQDGFTIEPRNYWFDDWYYEEENGVLGIASFGLGAAGWGIDDSDAEAAEQLYAALKSRYGKWFGKVMQCFSKNCGASFGAVAEDPAFFGQLGFGLTDEAARMNLEAGQMGSMAQSMAEDQAKMALAVGVTTKCLKAVSKAFEAAKEARAAKNIAKYIYDPKTGQYKNSATGRFVSPKKLPWPKNNGFATPPVDTTLKPGTVVDRYGRPSGRYASQPGSTPSQRGMASGSEGMPYNQYRVAKPVPAKVGPAAPMSEFGASGGATQYMFEKPINQLVKEGFLEVIK
jgi:hypothetical protein